MERYAAGLSRIERSCARRMSVAAKADASKILLFCRHAEEILWLGCAASPGGCYMASIMKQHIWTLKVLDIVRANEAVKLQSHTGPRIYFQNPNEANGETGSFSIGPYADAAINVSALGSYGQTGIVVGIVFLERCERHKFYRLID